MFRRLFAVVGGILGRSWLRHTRRPTDAHADSFVNRRGHKGPNPQTLDDIVQRVRLMSESLVEKYAQRH